ncbi:metal ABC transporter substrate-binding protein [Histidinibacterium lentulum]|uniref:High-affinity zinc uptake system protein ZnuA n=1 Tax=Histidinibacterium lentulum TaxID=2480588 RepID=A0A3N2R8F4_9RHOB|nr:metal ABC transporter substrate-binding protein [Histidinibacterium lentulum]ROU03698.1 zinc ABC transporter substrate-binding protein [Histidinibacterium lentulum]
MRSLALAAILASPAAAQDRPAVVATVNYPLAYFAERLAGTEQVSVLFPVPADRDPAFWRPTIADISEIQSADLIALNGAGFADWVARASLPRARLVDTSELFAETLIETESITHSHGADGEHSHTGTASFTWLDFEQAATQARSLATAMERRIPAVAVGLHARLADLEADLMALDAEAEDIGTALSGVTLVATHPRYQYFARAYGLEIVSLDWDAGAMPEDAQWQALSDLMSGTGAEVLIWEAAPPEEAMVRAADLGLAQAVFPPLANRPAEGDFLTAMRASLDALGVLALELATD